jgi:hypothetical protein
MARATTKASPSLRVAVTRAHDAAVCFLVPNITSIKHDSEPEKKLFYLALNRKLPAQMIEFLTGPFGSQEPGGLLG